jgi:TonB family protein
LICTTTRSSKRNPLSWAVGVLISLQLPVVSPAQTAPPADAIKARLAWRYDVPRLCPGLRVAEEGFGATVVFLVGASGVPSKASIRSSSRAEALDKATLSCIPNLRFQPDTRLGSGEAIPSWQLMALEWAPRPPTEPPVDPRTNATPNGAPAGPSGVVSSQVPGTAPNNGYVASAAPAATSTGSAWSGPGAKTVPVTVRVCDDGTGKLAQPPAVVRSSGVPAFDDAAVKIAAAGAPNYRPAATVDGKAASGCARLVIEFETK